MGTRHSESHTDPFALLMQRPKVSLRSRGLNELGCDGNYRLGNYALDSQPTCTSVSLCPTKYSSTKI